MSKIPTRNEYGDGWISRKRAIRAIERGQAYEQDGVLVFGRRPRPAGAVHYQPERPRLVDCGPVTAPPDWSACWRTAEAAVAWPWVHDQFSGR